MKIITDKNGYITSIFILLLLIPIIMLTIIIIEEYSHDTNNTIQTIESEKLKSKTEDFENEIITTTKQSLHEITLNIITTKKSLKDSRKYSKEYIQSKINQKQEKYKQDNININTQIKTIDSSNNPFKIELKYHIKATTNNTNIQINKDETKLIDITDNKYPVYDPLPTLKTGSEYKNNQIHYQDKLEQYLNIENSNAYQNITTHIIIKKCPYEEYSHHGNNNQTITNCLKNHYYHNSHDGMCILCRLENKTHCNHYGFETFIQPTHIYEKAPASIDHVLLNDKNTQYEGNIIKINNQTVLYLDNGHKTKYGL